jgi:hypothetical protein
MFWTKKNLATLLPTRMHIDDERFVAIYYRDSDILFIDPLTNEALTRFPIQTEKRVIISAFVECERNEGKTLNHFLGKRDGERNFAPILPNTFSPILHICICNIFSQICVNFLQICEECILSIFSKYL